MTFARRAGVGRLRDGRTVTWSLADGRRGRRWRASTLAADGRLLEDLLLELDPAGRLSKIELAGPGGLLSLHPEGSWLHGNVVGGAGVRHLRQTWTADHVVLVEGSPVTEAAVVRGGRAGGLGERTRVEAILVAADLSIHVATADLERVSNDAVLIIIDGERRYVRLDADGVPEELRSGGDWPLELD